MQYINGKLYPPMAAVVAGSLEDGSELGQWEMSTERPDLAKPKFNKKKGDYQRDKNGEIAYFFDLDKGDKNVSTKKVPARYNPYIHSSNYVLNDQFAGAYERPNIVTV